MQEMEIFSADFQQGRTTHYDSMTLLDPAPIVRLIPLLPYKYSPSNRNRCLSQRPCVPCPRNNVALLAVIIHALHLRAVPAEEKSSSSRSQRFPSLRCFSTPVHTRFRPIEAHHLFCICCVSCALCSWKRSLTRCCVAIHLSTQRLMQPFSRVDTALEVKSSTHEVKQCSTRPPKAPMNSFTWRFCMRCSSVRCSVCVNMSMVEGALGELNLGGWLWFLKGDRWGLAC